MVKKLFIFLFTFLLFAATLQAQQCTALGQNPGTAFPVCGTTLFNQTTVPICGSNSLVVPGCPGPPRGADYRNKNPFWYKFTCYQSGTLGFLITPLDLGDDYDWQLYDITGRDPEEVYTNSSLIVTGNWAGTYGATGASNSGLNFIQCASAPEENKNSFARMPNLIEGHEYILLVSHYTETQSGYGLSFGGGTAVITDPKLPALLDGEAACDGQQIRIRLNKKMKCKSLAGNGSDFTITAPGPGISIVSAVATQCGTGFDMDMLTLTTNVPMPPGTYTVNIKNGADGNTLLDNCDRNIAVGDKVSFTVFPLIPTPMDSLTKLKCAPNTLELVFKKLMRCNTVAPDGSDFEVIGGPVPVTVSGAAGINCVDGLSKKISVQLSGPIQVGGFYTIRLKTGTDGNTIFDECNQQTPAGSQIVFEAKDTVNAAFTYNIIYGCEKDVVQYLHNGANNVNSWTWLFDNNITNTTAQPIITYTDFRQKRAQLIVSNGVCSDTSMQNIFFDNLLVADFDISSIVCPNEPAKIVNNTIGTIVQWNWTFGNGSISNVKSPPPQSFPPLSANNYIAAPQLIVLNNYGCYDTVSRPVKVVFSCYIAVPKAFTPNGDGVNDELYPLSAYKANNLEFSVYNRFGQRLFYSNDWTKRWDGKFRGQGADPGTYVWMLSYTDAAGRRVNQKGSSVLIR